MLPLLIINPNLEARQKKIQQLLADYNLSQNHPNVFYLDEDSKLGMAEVSKIRNHLNLKPYQKGKQTVVIVAAENLSLDAQNSLLKTLEEPPQDSLIILASASEDQLLPTIISRCQVQNTVQNSDLTPQAMLIKHQSTILELIKTPISDRFKFVEKLTDKPNFLQGLVIFYQQQLHSNPQSKEINLFLKKLIKSERLLKQNVNPRAILEYLMLQLPTGKD